MVYTRLLQHSILTFGQKMEEVANLIREYESELLKIMKEKLVVLLKEKYDMVLTDDEWSEVMKTSDSSER